MNPIFSITVKDIQNLSDEQSRELVARLCRAELRKNGISPAAVSWGGDQRAKDGGVDVFVDVDPAMGLNGYIKNDQCVFQVKAEKFSKGKIPGEMAPKGKLRPAIAELAKKNGAYVIVSTRDSLAGGSRTESSLAQRITAMKGCLLDQGLDDRVIVDFYDCRKIADWVEEHPCIANWIRHIVGKPILGWQPYAPWAYKESDTESRYLIDERVKVFVPNAEKGSDVLSAINRLRRELSKNVSVRIVGLSGVGKTRLVQALFDQRIITEQPTLDAVYVADEDGEYITACRLVSLSMGEQQKTAISEVPDDILIEWCDISPEERYIFAADTCQLIEKSYSDQSPTNTTLALSAVAKSDFAGAKDKKAVLEVFSNRFHPRSYYDGSLSAILKKRLELLPTLNPTDDEALRIQIAPAEEALKTIIAAIAAREEAEERSRTGSFE